jgi:hypothetical protein
MRAKCGSARRCGRQSSCPPEPTPVGVVASMCLGPTGRQCRNRLAPLRTRGHYAGQCCDTSTCLRLPHGRACSARDRRWSGDVGRRGRAARPGEFLATGRTLWRMFGAGARGVAQCAVSGIQHPARAPVARAINFEDGAGHGAVAAPAPVITIGGCTRSRGASPVVVADTCVAQADASDAMAQNGARGRRSGRIEPACRRRVGDCRSGWLTPRRQCLLRRLGQGRELSR